MSEATESNSPLEDGYSYESVDVIPLLCDSCQEPLTLSSTMKSLVMATNSLDFPIEVSGQDLCHACQGQRQFDPSRIMMTAEDSALKYFESNLRADEYRKIARKATFSDVMAEVIACKNAQEAALSKLPRGHRHLDILLQRIHLYSGVVDTAIQNTTQPASLIWASMKFLIQVTSSYVSIQTKLSNMLIEIADSLGRVQLLKELYPTEHIQCIGATLYAEIVDLLKSMISFWHKKRLDKKILHAFWNPFEVEYQAAAERIRYLVDQIDRTATASHMAITKTQNMDILLAIRGIQARLDAHHNHLLILQENTSIARQYSLRLRQYLISSETQEIQEGVVQFHLARQSSRSCNFVLRNLHYQKWSQVRGSRILGLVGAPGSGKTAVSVFIFNNIQSLASEGAAVLFLNCIPVTHSSRMQLLRYMIWQLLEQRSDVLFKWIRSEGYYMRLFREATTFEALWSLFTQIVRALEEVWIVIDSIHDCSDGRERLLSELKALTKSSGLKTRIKLAISSRHATDVETISDAVMQYSSKDMQEAIVEYVSHEAFLMGDRGSILLKLSPEISAAVERLGGMTVWRGPIVRLVMSTSSDGEARQLLSRITSTDALVDSLWKNINQHPEPRRTLIMAVIRILVNVGGQFSVMQIYNALHESNPRILEGVDINILGPLVKDELSAYTSFGHGFFLMENVVRQHFQRRFFPPEYEEIENPENPSFEKPQQVLLQPQCNQNVPQWRVGALSAIYNSRGFLPALCLSLLLFFLFGF